MTPHILKFGIRLRSVVKFHAPATLPPENELWYPLNGRLSGVQSLSERFGEEGNRLPLPGFEPRIFQPYRSHSLGVK